MPNFIALNINYLSLILLVIITATGLTSCSDRAATQNTIAQNRQSKGSSVVVILNGQKPVDSTSRTDLVEKLDTKSIEPLQAQMLESGAVELSYLAICGSPPPIELTIEPSKVTISEEQIASLPPYKRKAAWEDRLKQQEIDKQRIATSKVEIGNFDRKIDTSIKKTDRNCRPDDLLKAYNRASISLSQQRSQSSLPPTKYLLIVSNQLSFYKNLAKVRCPEGVECSIVAASRPRELDPKFQLFSSTSSALKSITSKIVKN